MDPLDPVDRASVALPAQPEAAGQARRVVAERARILRPGLDPGASTPRCCSRASW